MPIFMKANILVLFTSQNRQVPPVCHTLAVHPQQITAPLFRHFTDARLRVQVPASHPVCLKAPLLRKMTAFRPSAPNLYQSMTPTFGTEIESKKVGPFLKSQNELAIVRASPHTSPFSKRAPPTVHPPRQPLSVPVLPHRLQNWLSPLVP